MAARKRKRILVVDDEPGALSLMAEVFHEAGYEVLMAVNGHKAMATLTRERFDLVVTDLNMPVWSGRDLLRWMKAAGRSERVIVMTGSPVRDLFKEEDMHPVDATFTKPFKIPALLETVNILLAVGRTARRGVRAGRKKGMAL